MNRAARVLKTAVDSRPIPAAMPIAAVILELSEREPSEGYRSYCTARGARRDSLPLLAAHLLQGTAPSDDLVKHGVHGFLV